MVTQTSVRHDSDSCSSAMMLISLYEVYHVLLHLHQQLNLGSFFRLIEDGGSRLAPASKLLQVYAREQNRDMLRDFYYSDDRRMESAVLAIDECARITVSRWSEQCISG